MRRVFGPRTAVEAAFIVAVPVIAAALGARTWTIIAASAVAYLIIVVLEATLGRREGSSAPGRSRMRIPLRTALVKRQSAASSPEPEAAPVAGDDVLVHEIALEAEPVAAAEPPSRPEPAPVPVPAAAAPSAAPEPSFTATTPSEHVRVLRPEPVAERPQLTAVPELEPEPVAVVPVAAATELAPEPSTVVPIGVGAGPRQWNLWDLERLTREHTGADIAQDEERQFLLMYLREFADSAGLLPLDFDGLVRDSFGELVGTR
jgi:hypothetical protein